MISAQELNHFFSIQLSVFTPPKILPSSKILKNLLSILPDEFDGEPTILPLPEDAPAEIPRITFQDKNKTKFFEIAPKRANIKYIRASKEENFNETNIVSNSSELLVSYLNKQFAECNRIALILNRFAYKNNPESELASHFCKDNFLNEPFDSPSEFQIHALKKYKLNNLFDVNSWVRIKSGSVTFDPNQYRVVFYEQDLNTLQELIEEKTYDNQEIEKFFNAAITDSNSTVSKYFPN